MMWSPPSYSAQMRQLMNATTPPRMGAPYREGRQGTPANLSVPERAKAFDSPSCASDSMLTQKVSAWRTFSQLAEERDGANVTMGGSSDREAKDWQVKPTGSRSRTAVMTVTPEQKWPSTLRSVAA